MRTAKPMAQADQIRHLRANLLIRLAGEWATPGVEAALQRAVAGLGSGIEPASTRVQKALRWITGGLAEWNY